MKLSDIVKVNITNIPSYDANSLQMNSVAAVLFVHKLGSGETATSDTNWVAFESLYPENEGYVGDDIIGRIEKTYRLNGGISLVCKRIYLATDATTEAGMTALTNAVIGGGSQIALGSSIKNIQLAFDSTFVPTISILADNLVDSTAPENTKILFITSNSLPTGLITRPNVFYHYSTSTGTFVNYYESAAAMAYLSKIVYTSDQIQDYEYTEWTGLPTEINTVSVKPSQLQGYVNIFTPLANRTVIIGGVMTNNVRLITYYFELILTDILTNRLATLTLNKLKFNSSTYGLLYNAITIELDVFALNGLLDKQFVAKQDEIIFRDSIRYRLVRKDEIMSFGYVVNVLPPTQADITARKYTGIYIHFAISNQIRTIEVSGLALGGIN
jgi:hypothetical protein